MDKTSSTSKINQAHTSNMNNLLNQHKTIIVDIIL